MTLYNQGKAAKITVDDQVPYRYSRKTKIPAYNQKGINGGWWNVILEKAYAKLNLNYLNLALGTSIPAFRELTGMPVFKFHGAKQSAKTFWSIL